MAKKEDEKRREFEKISSLRVMKNAFLINF